MKTKARQPKPGMCRVCGCTENNACTIVATLCLIPLVSGPCRWADATQTLCTNPNCLMVDAVASWKSEVCPACSKRKRDGDSFCARCHNKLTPALRAGLNQSVKTGYVPAYRQALSFLEKARAA